MKKKAIEIRVGLAQSNNLFENHPSGAKQMF